MPTLEWSDSFSIGVRQIDKHNENLVEVMRKTKEVLATNPSPFRVDTAVDEMISYIFYHLATEEIWMSRNKFPKLRAHIDEHLRYTASVVSLQGSLKAGVITAMEMLGCVYNMFVSHVLSVDMKYGHYLATRS